MTGRQLAPDAAPHGFGRRLAGFSSSLRFDDLPDDVRTVARHCVLDWLGVTLAGFREPAARLVLAETLEQGGAPQATILGAGLRTSVGHAALVNGTASHALDYDDVQYAWCVHTSVSVLPAVLALAERDARGGRDLMTAFVAGVETSCRVAQFVTEEHRARGYHATGTVGTFGAAAGAARMLGLGAEDSATAFGIAATQAAGLVAMFGTMCKPLHAGKAAANGMHAALLARRGFSSRGDGIECAQGFAGAESPVCAPRGVLDGLGEEFRIRDVVFKYHAACYSTHATIDAAARLREAHAMDPMAIEAVEVRVPPSCLAICNIQRPATGLEAKFSLRLASAMALCARDTSEPGTFSDATCVDAELVALRDRTRVVADQALVRGVSVVKVSMTNGDLYRQRSNLSLPNRDLEDQGRRLRSKFHALAAPVIGPANAHDVVGLVDELERVDHVETIVRCCVAVGGTRRPGRRARTAGT